jgi:hypothetical protein
MMAKVRRRATSDARGERDGDSAVTVKSDMAQAFGRETVTDQGAARDPEKCDVAFRKRSMRKQQPKARW